jgi:hypothetical protein
MSGIEYLRKELKITSVHEEHVMAASKVEIISVNGKEYVKPIKLAAVVGVPPQYIYQLVSQGKLACEIIIGQKFIPIKAATEFITKRSQKTAPVTIDQLVATLSDQERKDLLAKLTGK